MGCSNPPFSAAVQRCFSRSAGAYETSARLQAGVAQRLAQLCRPMAADLPQGARADLGAGSGLLARAIDAAIGGEPLLRLDACDQLLQQEPPQPQPAAHQQWDLNQGLPPQLQGAALLASSFALQWLDQPERELSRWCDALQPGGALALAVPCRGSFQLWHQACNRAKVPCTALLLPSASALINTAAAQLELKQQRTVYYSRPNRGARAFLRQIKTIGAQASRSAPLPVGQMRALIEHWPGSEQAIVWEVLILVGRKR